MEGNAIFGNFGGSVNSEGAYEVSFGNVPEGTIVDDVFRKARWEEIQKALDLTSGSGQTILPLYVDPDIIDRTRRDTPLVEVIRKVTNKGRTADYNAITAKGGARFRSEANAESNLSAADDTYARASTAIKYCYAVGSVTGPAKAALASYTNATALEIQNKTKDLYRLVDNVLINGDTSTQTSAREIQAGDEFDGFIALVTTNTTANGATNSDLIEDIRAARDSAYNNGGVTDLLVMYSNTKSVLEGQIMSYQRYIDKTELAFGTKVSAFDDMAIVKDRYMPSTAASRQVLVLDTSVCEQRILQDATLEELAQTGDSKPFMIKWYGALIVKAETFCARVTGCN